MWRVYISRVPVIRFIQDRTARQISALLIFPLVVFVFALTYTVYQAVEGEDEVKIIHWGLALVCGLGITLVGLAFCHAWRGGRRIGVQPSGEQQHDVAVRHQHWYENLFRILWSQRYVPDTESGREHPSTSSTAEVGESTVKEETETGSPGTSSSQKLEVKTPSDSKCDDESRASSSREAGTDLEASAKADSTLSKVLEVTSAVSSMALSDSGDGEHSQQMDVCEPLLPQGKEDEGDTQVRQRKVSPPSNQAPADGSGKEAEDPAL